MPHNIQDIAQKILVQHNNQPGESRVHITVHDSILPRTDIQLHQQHGKLSVVVSTSSPLSHNIMSGHIEGLQSFLSEQTDHEVTVRLDYQSQDSEQEESQQRAYAEAYRQEQNE
ncbi:MAG: hypothetical protein GDA54_03130 [Alphaproteobacteria bacterium GM7ARS4]|nr:hypothetical protein [Alphaproteobacteria bacterium GM7ARS4]